VPEEKVPPERDRARAAMYAQGDAGDGGGCGGSAPGPCPGDGMSGAGLGNAASRGMRIAGVIERFDPEAGGAERSTAQIVAELARRGPTPVVLAGASPMRGYAVGQTQVEVQRMSE